MATYIEIKIYDRYIDVVFNALSNNPDINAKNGLYKRSSIINVWYRHDGVIEVVMQDGAKYPLSVSASPIQGTFLVECFNFVDDGTGEETPVNADQLCEMLRRIFI